MDVTTSPTKTPTSTITSSSPPSGAYSDLGSTGFTVAWDLDDDSLWLAHEDTIFDEPDKMNQVASVNREHYIPKPSDCTFGLATTS